MKKKLLFAILIIIICVAAAACAPEILYPDSTVVSISVDNITVTDYYMGDVIDVTDATVIAVYSDGRTETVPLELGMLSGYDMNVAEIDKVITVNYGGCTTQFTVNVIEPNALNVTLSKLPYKTSYIEGETVTAEGAYLTVHYDSGRDVEVKVTDKMLESYDNNRVGEQEIFISFYGRRLSFTVVFEQKTPIEISVLQLPAQTSVYLDQGDKFSLAGMRLRVKYDNGLAPSVPAEDIMSELHYYIDDSLVGATVAKIAYLPEGYSRVFTYKYGTNLGLDNSGNALVKPGDYVYPNLSLASNSLLDDTRSKCYGQVISAENGTIEVSTVVDYEVVTPAVEVGQILLPDEVLGTYGNTEVTATAGGGIVTEVGNGVVTMQTVPVLRFPVSVRDKDFESMRLITSPRSKKFGSDVNEIIQGDELDLSSGLVEVTYTNGETELVRMDDKRIGVINSDKDMLRSDIEGLTFTSVENVERADPGRYELKFGVEHPYGTDGVYVMVSVVDESGNNLFVQDTSDIDGKHRYFISLGNAKNYTVSITATLRSDSSKVSEAMYYISTKGAPVRQNRLDLTAAGQHEVLVYYGGVRANGFTIIVYVTQRYPVALDIVEESNFIRGNEFPKGTELQIGRLEYIVTYNNEEVSDPIGVTRDMVDEDYSVYCNTIGPNQIRFFITNTLSGEKVVSDEFSFTVVPLKIRSMTFEEEPLDVFITSGGTTGSASLDSNVNLSGGILRVLYEDDTIKRIGDVSTGGTSLPDLLVKTSGENIKVDYVYTYSAAPEKAFTIDEVLAGEHYVCNVEYTDEDGETGYAPLDYCIINQSDRVSSINALAQNGYKNVYIQCEDWYLDGISLSVTYYAGSDGQAATRIIPVTESMIYQTTTDEVGVDIPLKIKFFGKVTENLKFTVIPRMETAISVRTRGKQFFRNVGERLDLSDYIFEISYNAGSSVQTYGPGPEQLFTSNVGNPEWWYELFEKEKDNRGNDIVANFADPGDKRVRLHHTSVTVIDNGGVLTTAYTDVFTEFEIEVRENTSRVKSISYDPGDLGYAGTEGSAEYPYLPVLAEVAPFWDLFLYEYDSDNGIMRPKYLKVRFADAEGEYDGEVAITADMLDYSRAVGDYGYRVVTITYGGASTKVYVNVWRGAEFTGIRVEKKPVSNFIAGSELSLEGGIIRLVFTASVTGGTLEYEKFIEMTANGVSATGFNSDISPDIDHLEETITLTYRGMSTGYQIVVYNKQGIDFVYQNTISFYGNTKAADATPIQVIYEFDLPDSSDMIMWYAENKYFIPDAEFEQWLIDNHRTNTENEFMKLMMRVRTGDEDEYRIEYYWVERIHLSSKFFMTPATREGGISYDYYIIMEVRGNDYYRAENYAYQKFTIIPKVIEVRAVEATDNAYIKKYSFGSSNPAAILYLYTNLKSIYESIKADMSADENYFSHIYDLALYSPNASGFEIGITGTPEFNHEGEDKKIVEDIFKALENYMQANATAMGVASGEGLSVGTMRRGINVGEYNGKTPEYATYQIDYGELLTLGGVLDLPSGSLDFGEDYNYGSGRYTITVGTLFHNNYNMDFRATTFTVNPHRIKSYRLIDNVGQLTVDGASVEANAWMNATPDKRVWTIPAGDMGGFAIQVDGRTLNSDEYYFEGDGVSGRGLPTAAGTYKITVASESAFVWDTNGNKADFSFTLVVTG